MAIDLPPTVVGFTIFVCILIFLQIFFGTIGALISNFIGLTGLSWWIITVGIVLILDSIFINIRS